MQPWLPLPLSALLLGLAPPLAAQGRPHQNACGVLHFVGTTVCPPGFVQPVDWYSGDTHEHIQHCFTPTDDTPLEIYQEMLADQLDLSNALIWGAGFITPDQFKAYVQQFLTGAEDPVTAADPTKILQFGVETSGVSAGNLGHMIGLNITPAEADVFQLQLGCGPYYPAVGWKNDGSGDYSEPVLDLFRQAPKAVTGYAHQSWPVDLYADVFAGGWDWEDPTLPSYVGTDAKCSFGMDLAFPIPKTCGNTHPVLAPFDVALGRIDFLEGFDLLEPTCGGPLEKRYFGMYYKLLNAGQFVALSAGTDADCIDTGCEPRTWVRLEPGEAFTYDAWTQGLKEGRTSVSYGAYQFLEMTVDDVPVGERLNLSGTPTVKVKATYHVDLQDGSTVSDTIEIVQDGAVVASESFGPLGMGSHTFEVDVPVQRSGWIAARTASYGTHTSTVHTFVDKTPVANCADAEYWALYADFLNAQLDVAAATGPGAPGVLRGLLGARDPRLRRPRAPHLRRRPRLRPGASGGRHARGLVLALVLWFPAGDGDRRHTRRRSSL